MAREKTIDLTRRVIKVAEWGARYSYNQLDASIKNIDQEANISAIISFKNKGQDVEKLLAKNATNILKAANENEIAVRQMHLQNIIESIYPEAKYQNGELKDYEPHNRMMALSKLLCGYKKISLNAYDKGQNILNILTFRSYIMTILPENDIHRKAADKLREYLQIAQPFNTPKQ